MWVEQGPVSILSVPRCNIAVPRGPEIDLRVIKYIISNNYACRERRRRATNSIAAWCKHLDIENAPGRGVVPAKRISSICIQTLYARRKSLQLADSRGPRTRGRGVEEVGATIYIIYRIPSE